MNVRGALLETAQLAREIEYSRQFKPDLRIRREFFDHPSIGYNHIMEMYNRTLTEEMSDTKLNRWLGWMQCAICTWSNTVTVEDMKIINRRHT